MARLQFEAVRAAQTGVDFRQFVWIPEEIGPTDEQQLEFLEAVRQIGDAKTEVICNTSRSALIDTVSKELEKKVTRPRVGQPRSVFLMCTQEDFGTRELQALRKHLLELGIPVEEPAFKGDPTVIEELRVQSLTQTDAAVIYYGNCDDAWVQLMRMKLRKDLPPAARDTYLRSVYLCIPPDSLKRDRYLTLPSRKVAEPGIAQPLLVLGDCSPFAPESIEPLIEALAGGQG